MALNSVVLDTSIFRPSAPVAHPRQPVNGQGPILYSDGSPIVGERLLFERRNCQLFKRHRKRSACQGS